MKTYFLLCSVGLLLMNVLFQHCNVNCDSIVFSCAFIQKSSPPSSSLSVLCQACVGLQDVYQDPADSCLPVNQIQTIQLPLLLEGEQGVGIPTCSVCEMQCQSKQRKENFKAIKTGDKRFLTFAWILERTSSFCVESIACLYLITIPSIFWR